MLQVGDKMPRFAVADETGKMVTDKDLIGKKTVIYFYPKDLRLKHVTSATTTMLSWRRVIKCLVSARTARLRISSSRRNTIYPSRS